MADKDTAITPTREGRGQSVSRPFGWHASPFSALQRFTDQMDRMFDDFGFGRRAMSPFWRQSAFEAWAPDVEVFQKNNELTIRADLPGLNKDEVSVEVSDDSVIVHGERKREHQEEREGLYRSERTYGSFYRVIPLPEGAITEQAKANFRNGVLEITMPAPPASRGRRLEIAEEAKK
jgi:HSP20 family protein